MFTSKVILLAVFVIGVNCRYVLEDEYKRPHFYIEDSANIIEDDLEDMLSEPVEYVRPHVRRTRQLHGLMNTNPDGSANINAKLPLAGNDHNRLSALGSIAGAKNGGFGSAAGGLALENEHGHALTGTARHIPGFGNQLTGAAKVNLLNTDDHKLNANAFVTRNMPTIPNVPNFNTRGGSLDYMFKDKIGASLGASNTDFIKRTDYSAMGNLNLFRNPSSSLDLNAGFTKSVSPFIPNRSWQPAGGLSFTRYW